MRVYLDSMIWIYALEGNAQFGSGAQQLLRNIRAFGHVLLTSHFLLAEVLVQPTRKADTALATAYRRMLTGAGVEVVPFTADVAAQFASVRVQLQARSGDAIHLALASVACAEMFVTEDLWLLGNTTLQPVSLLNISSALRKTVVA